MKDGNTLGWAARWIEGSLKGETNERVIEFGKNMAMTLRAAMDTPHVETPMKQCTDCGKLFRYPPSDNKPDATTCAWCTPHVEEEKNGDPWARFKEMIRIANSRPCPDCGHSDVASDGLCAALVPLIDKEPHGSKRCRCPCVNFAMDELDHGGDTQDTASPKERNSSTVPDHDVVGSDLPESESDISSKLAEIREQSPYRQRAVDYVCERFTHVDVDVPHEDEIRERMWGREAVKLIKAQHADCNTLLSIIDSLQAENKVDEDLEVG